jgi:hypothetical protein
MFDHGKKASLIFVSEVAACPRGALKNGWIMAISANFRLASKLARKIHSSLFGIIVSGEAKRFYNFFFLLLIHHKNKLQCLYLEKTFSA